LAGCGPGDLNGFCGEVGGTDEALGMEDAALEAMGLVVVGE